MTADLPPLVEDEAALFNALPADGSGVTNPALRQYLRWSQNRYFTARDGLVDKGLVARGRGRGGVIRRSNATQPGGEHVVAVVVEGDTADAEMIEAAIVTDDDGVIVLGAQLAAARAAEISRVPAGPSPIAGVNYPPGSGCLWRWSERSQDEVLSSFVESYMRAGNSGRTGIRAALDMDDLYTMLLFSQRRAFAAIRSADRAAVIEAFNALATIDIARVDPRDVAVATFLAAYAARRAGIDARLAASAAVRHAAAEVAGILANIAERDEIDLARMYGSRVVATQDGLVLLSDHSEHYEPERDLGAIMLAAVAAIEADSTYMVGDVGVADVLRLTWVKPSGVEEPRIAAALQSVTGCASLHGYPVERREGHHSLMGWLAEAGTDEAAAIIADGANRADKTHATIAGISSGLLVMVLVASSGEASRPSLETTQTMARFQQLRNLF